MKSISTIITGIGYMNNHSLGGIKRGLEVDCENVSDGYNVLSEHAVLLKKIKYFSRFNEESKRVCLTTTIALHDARIPHGTAPGDTGIIAASHNGALLPNIEYFRDYIDSGRKLARGNLFIYTLPTSPLAETAICLGLNGPILYASDNSLNASFALTEADDMVKAGKARIMVAVIQTQEETVCFVVKKETKSDNGIIAEDLIQILSDAKGSVVEELKQTRPRMLLKGK